MPQPVRQKPSCGDRVWARGAGLALVAASLLSACQCGAVGALPCSSAADCPADQLCRDAQCRRACNSRGDCGSGELCVDGACVPATAPTDAARTDGAAADQLLRDLASVERAAADGAVADSGLSDLTAADTSAPDASALDGSGDEAGRPDAPALDGPQADGPSADQGAIDALREDSGPADQVFDVGTPPDASGTADGYTVADTGLAADTSTATDSASAPDLATPPDTTVVDSGPPAAQLACLARYGTATDFLYCGGGDGWCEFYAATAGTSCQDLCTARGGTCLGVQDNQGGVGTITCEPLATTAVCTTAMNDGLCRCTTEVGDAGSGDAAAASCSALYGATPGFLLCREDATSCEFYYLDSASTNACSGICAARGGDCLAAHDNPDPVGTASCEYKPVARTCDDTHTDAICTCTR